MEEKELKTSVKQRIGIIAVAVIMIGSIIASYVAIVANGSNSADDGSISDEKLLAYETAYADKITEFQAATSQDYSKYSQYISRIVAYDEDAANNNGIKTKDLVTGSGRELKSGDTDYLAYYTGWCSDGSIFDSTLDNTTNPNGFASALTASSGLISGWTAGVIGMKLGGVREITLPGDKAYADEREICGGYFKPLKFLIMAVANEEPVSTLASELREAYVRLQYAYYGLDYDKIIQQ